VLSHVTYQWAANSAHWFFMALPYDIPEKLIEGKEGFYILNKLTKIGIGKGGFSPETLAEYARCCTPQNIHGVCEDYRAGIGIARDRDTADFEAGRKVECPPALYWGALGHPEKFYDPREVWPRYCSNIVRLRSLACGHYPAEQVPDEVCEELHTFFGS